MGIILASGSPRRRELLTLAGIDFEIVKSECEEVLPKKIKPCDAVILLSQQKAVDVKQSRPDDTIIAADTVVSLNGNILGKPKDENDAAKMLRTLSGQIHTVYTGVTIIKNNTTESFYSATEVEFYPLTDSEILNYIKTGEPMDKAGAYGIQGKGSLLVKKINGDYFNVVGLPLAETVRRLK